MIRALVYILLVFALAAGIAWLAERPGEVAVSWLGYEIRTSMLVAAVALVAAIAVLLMLWWLIRGLLHSPETVGGFFSARRRDRGYRALSRGMIAVGAGDARRAHRNADEARRLLENEPLALLLAAQAAQLRGDAAAARRAFEAMLAEPDTRLLGLHGLYVEARRQDDHEAARHYAAEAAAAAPGLAWAGTALLDYQSAEGDWEGALRTLAANREARLVERSAADRMEAVLKTARAMELEDSQPETARSLAVDAHRLAPDLVPAAVVAARLASRLGDVRRATRIIEATWKLAPHPELAAAYSAARPGDSVRDRLKRARRLASLNPGAREGALALARAAIDAKAWGEARSALAGFVDTAPSERACLMMAEIEEGEHGDRGRVRDWLARAVRAARDPVWMADGYVFDAWAPVSPITGRLDAFRWKTPTERLAEPDHPPIEAAAIGTPSAAVEDRASRALAIEILDHPMTAPAEAANTESEPGRPPATAPAAPPEPVDVEIGPEPRARPEPMPSVAGPEPAQPVAAEPGAPAATMANGGASPQAPAQKEIAAMSVPDAGQKPADGRSAAGESEPPPEARPEEPPFPRPPDDPGPEPEPPGPKRRFRLFA